MGNKDKEFGSQVNLIENDKSQKKKSKKESSKPETILENGEQVTHFDLFIWAWTKQRIFTDDSWMNGIIHIA